MKRIVMITLLALSVSALIFAQGTDRRGDGRRGDGRLPQQISMEKTTVTGNLTIVRGMIAVKNSDMSYIIPGLFRFVGFIETLKDGVQVTIEGNAVNRNTEAKTAVLMPLKLTISGKEYDVGTPFEQGNLYQGRQGPMQPQQGYRENNRRQGPGCSCNANPRFNQQSQKRTHKK